MTRTGSCTKLILHVQVVVLRVQILTLHVQVVLRVQMLVLHVQVVVLRVQILVLQVHAVVVVQREDLTVEKLMNKFVTLESVDDVVCDKCQHSASFVKKLTLGKACWLSLCLSLSVCLRVCLSVCDKGVSIVCHLLRNSL